MVKPGSEGNTKYKTRMLMRLAKVILTQNSAGGTPPLFTIKCLRP